MPLYEYRCNTCGQVFEKMLRWSEADRSPACPHCESQDTSKKISTFASIGAASLGAASVGASTSGGASYTSSGCGSSGRFG